MQQNQAANHVGHEAWTSHQILVVMLCCVINMLDGMDVLIVSFVAPALSEEWQVDFETLGVVFSAGLAGMMVGSIVLAPLADFVGRRPIILAGIVLISVGTIACGIAESVTSFALYRVVVGCGIGAIIASVAALVAEYAPPTRRTTAIGIFQSGYPLGAVLTGFICIWSIPRFGWQPTLIGAGVASTILIPVLWWLLPESIGGPLKKTAENTRGEGASQSVSEAEQAAQSAHGSWRLAKLFVDGMWRNTVLLWFATLLAYGVLYFVTSWIPKLAIEAGLNPTDALLAGTLFNLGGFFGGLMMGRFAERRRVGHLIAAFFVVSSIAMALFGGAGQYALAVALGLAFIIGTSLQGGFTGFYSLGALLYSDQVRSSGIGWAVGIGRAGSVGGPLVGGYLLAQGLPIWIVMLCFAAPLLISGWISMIAGRNIAPPMKGR
ncbi:MAG: MFS transporter [Rhodobacteraceae bacterium]|nr:MFS transporter [Paracoccaceae bacterium]